MTALTPVTASRAAGLDNTAAGTTTTSGDTFPAGPNTYLRVRNTTGSAVTVTVNPPAAGGPSGTTIAPVVLAPAVAATTGDRTYGPFPAYPYGDANGNINFACAANGAGITAQAIIYPGA
jgi:hypothetical protein